MRQPRIIYNIKSIIKAKMPKILYQRQLESIISNIFKTYDKNLDSLQNRINFYNKLQSPFTLPQNESKFPPTQILDNSTKYSPLSRLHRVEIIAPHLDLIRKNSAKYGSVYYYDSEEWLRYFPNHLRWAFLYNDVSSLLNFPSIVKSRPILPQNSNSVLLQLEKYRHFQFVQDTINFQDKKDMLMFRGAVYQRHRIRFFQKYFHHPKCDIGHVGRIDSDASLSKVMGDNAFEENFYKKKQSDSPQSNLKQNKESQSLSTPSHESPCDFNVLNSSISHKKFHNQYSQYSNPQLQQNLHTLWQKPKISIKQHLHYKFLLSLEGYDVASNLKWILSSNSLCMMPKPEMETWFMESQLKANIHYVEIDRQYDNVEEQMEYYLHKPNEAQEIIHNAQEFCKQFFDARLEGAINLLVLRKYFYLSGQLDISKKEEELFGV